MELIKFTSKSGNVAKFVDVQNIATIKQLSEEGWVADANKTYESGELMGILRHGKANNRAKMTAKDNAIYAILRAGGKVKVDAEAETVTKETKAKKTKK